MEMIDYFLFYVPKLATSFSSLEIRSCVGKLSCKFYLFSVKVPGTNFSLCVVLGKDDQQSRLRPNQQGLKKDGVFYYHRLDFNSLGNIPKCREYQRYSTKGIV
jgi:hypothetical protein